MPLDLTKLPLLLAGPQVRRVEPDLVSIWIATSRPCNASLLLFEGADIPASKTPTDDLRAQWVSNIQVTLPIGAHVHVLTVVLDLRTPGGNAARSGGTLKPDQVYSYDLQLFPQGETKAQTLRTLGLLADPIPLGFDVDKLPSFKTAPDKREKLVIVHGSCRLMFATPPIADDPAKDGPFPPPGGWPPPEPSPSNPAPQPSADDEFPSEEYPRVPKRDGLFWVDALIDTRGPIPQVAKRPHQMFLTGDQIYADDVPAVLLPVLNTIGRELVSREDLAADAAGTSFIDATFENFPPNFRKDIVLRRGGFTTSDGESHLLTFGEFIAYYLLTWSPALWSLDLWPGVDITKLKMPPEWAQVLIFDDPDAVPPRNGPDTREFSDDFKALRDALPVGPGIPLKTAPPIEIAQWYFDQRCRWLNLRLFASADLFKWWMQRFSEGLPRVRRTLANVTTYMLADDHEVTDDWYFSRQWREMTFTRPLGFETIRHGLMAYSAMQAWGNDPRRWNVGLEQELLSEISRIATADPVARRQDLTVLAHVNRLHELLGLPFTPALGKPMPTFRPLVEYSYQIEGPCHRVLVIDGRTKRRFPERLAQAGGVDYEGPTGLFGDSPMAVALPVPPANDTKLTLVVTGVPVLGPEGMELALVPFQRLARLLLRVDAEAWSYDPATFEALLWAMARYKSVVLLSGDIHVGFSAALDYWSAPPNQPVQTARIVQLISSGITQDWGSTFTPTLKAVALTHDVFESVTTSMLPTERVGWGTPVREALTPPLKFDKAVTVKAPAVAHPSYRSRLKKMRAPVVPTHGWPKGSTESTDPHWAWRLTMARDVRPESTNTPTIDRRWTPVDLPTDPIAAAGVGWHAAAARRQAVGRVFCFQPNIGVVTFEQTGTDWSVRHVLVTELPPLPGTGTIPTGPQPYIVHRFSLTPKAPATWTSDRPKIHDDGGWGVDSSDAALLFLLKFLPEIWRRTAGFIDPLWPDLPLNVDEGTKESLVALAAQKIAKPFRRAILKELGPFAGKTDDELDALAATDVTNLATRVGALDVDRESREVVRPDLERLLDIDAAASDKAAFLDDALLVACSPWVRREHPLVSTVIGVIATFRSPVTKQAPVLASLINGLWDRWRKHTLLDRFTGNQVADAGLGLLFLPHRFVIFALQLLKNIVIDVIRDLDPAKTNLPPVFSSELLIAALGSYLSSRPNQRMITAAGWDPTETPVNPGTRRADFSDVTLARQTVSLLLYKGKTARYVAPPQRATMTFVPRPGPDATGDLFAGWDGQLNVEGPVGGGVIQRIETSGGGWMRQPWAFELPVVGVPGAKTIFSFRRPMMITSEDLRHIKGFEIRLTPRVAIALGFTTDSAGAHPSFELQLSLNDAEDRISFLPETDGLLSQILPTNGLTLPVDATVAWDSKQGWRFLGAGQFISPIAKDDTPSPPPSTPPTESEQKTTAHTPTNQKIGCLTLLERTIDAGYKKAGDGVDVTVTIAGTLALKLGPVRLALAGFGVELLFHFSGDGLHVTELFTPDVRPAMPTGLAVSVDAEVLSGGGFLQRIESPDGEVTWRGGLQLRLTDCFDIAAWGIVRSGGQQHWSLLVFLALRFDPPVRFGNFRLTSVGGVVGIHRSMDTDALRDAAMGLQGNLDTLILPEHAEQRFVELLPAVERFFPPAEDHYVFGLMAEAEWGATKKVTNARLKAALLFQLNDFKAALYGTIAIGFPTLTADHVVRIRAGVEALYDYEAKIARFSLTLTEAIVCKTVHLTGGAALFIRWGNKDEFAFTLGGFHPHFRPFIPEGLREPPRIGAHWKPKALLNLDIQMYFAVTCTSVQFGMSAHLEAGASWGGIRGDGNFDLIWMWEPSEYFELDLAFRVTAHLFGCDLISAGLRGTLYGPGPWHLDATIYWEVCGVDISKDLGPYEWGDPGTLSATTQEARQILGDAFDLPDSWSLQRNTRLPVRLRAGSEDAIDPRDHIEVRQAVLPLGTAIEVNDRNVLSDAGVWTLTATTTTLAKVGDVTDVFSTVRYLRKPPKETPFRSGLASGARFGGTGWDARTALAVVSDEDTTEDLVLDSIPAAPVRIKIPVRVPLESAVRVATPTRAIDRKWTRHQLELEVLE